MELILSSCNSNISIGAVVVLYNPNIEEILNINTYLDKVDYLVIMDNSEYDNSSKILKSISSTHKIKYYSEKKNLGLCKALNLGIEFLKKYGCSWALLFDADSKLGSDIISVYKKAIEYFQKDSISLFCPVHLFDRSKSVPFSGYRLVKWSMTSGCIFNIEVFCQLKGFFDALFVDGLDMDYCLKSKKYGYKIVQCGEAIIQHHPAETRCAFGFKYGIASPFRYFMQARQLIWVSFYYMEPVFFMTYLYKWFKVVFFFPNKLTYIRAMIKGSYEGVLLLLKNCKSSNIK